MIGKAPSARPDKLLVRSERRESIAPADARRMEDRFELARRQLTAARRAAKVIGFGQEDMAPAAESPVVEREAPARGAWSPGTCARTAFEALLSPFTIEEFFGDQESRARPMLLRGRAERFADLVRWSDLDTLLTTGKLDSGAVRMVVDGTDLAPGLFAATALGTGGRQRDERVAKVDGRKVRALAAEGAMLVLDRADRHLDPVAGLAGTFENALATYSRVNLYASWRATPGFQTHWDGHDVFVLQIHGEKTWRILGPTRVWPTREDSVLDESPPKTPLWTGRVTTGDLLYIPRGWWHDARIPAQSDGRGSLHLTCQIRSASGRDLLSWLGEWLQGDTLFRRPVPLWAGEEALVEYLERMKALIGTALDGAEAGEIARELRERWTERAPPGLGAWSEPRRDPQWPRYHLRLLGRAQAVCVKEGNSIKLAANGWTHTLDPRARGVVQALTRGGETDVEALRSAAADSGIGPREVDALLASWIRRGVLRAEAPGG